MKRIIILVLAFIFLWGCTSENVSEEEIIYYDAYADIDDDEILVIEYSPEMAGDITDPEYLKEKSSDIALVTITSIDGGSNHNESTNTNDFAYTYGKLEVLEVYKGDIKANDELNYVRTGGIIDFDTYYNSLDEEEKDKTLLETQKAYVYEKFYGDIDIEVGKTYLAYLNSPDKGEYPKEDACFISHFQGGLRAVDDSNGVHVLNNITGKWEAIEEIIK
mgnify:CR=1 FL=1